MDQQLIVESIIDDAILSEWNKAHPKQEISAGDQIIRVNDQVVPPDMYAEMRDQNKLRLMVRPQMPEPVDDLELWMEAAKCFEVNEDFDISAKLKGKKNLGFMALMNIMKKESAEKATIQALGDKILLSQLLDVLRVPQMPLLFFAKREADLAGVQEFVRGREEIEKSGENDAFDLVIKPTHLSNAAGTCIMNKKTWVAQGMSAERLHVHMNKYLARSADDCESEALKSLIPGFIAQPRYQSCIEFEAPLEMRVVTLWGKARLGIWWWGRVVPDKPPGPGQKPQRTAWLVRKSEAEGLSNTEDKWEVLHDHKGENKGFEKSLQLFLQAMPAMAVAAECIAKAVGAPFLRSDFFVGSEKWGVRLNEVAYGSGVDCRRRSRDGSVEAVDDNAAIGRILQEGFKLCKRRPAAEVLKTLGVQGSTYEDMQFAKRKRTLSDKLVDRLLQKERPRLPTAALDTFGAVNATNAFVSPVAAEDCETRTAADRRKSEELQSAFKAAGTPQVVDESNPQAQQIPALPKANKFSLNAPIGGRLIGEAYGARSARGALTPGYCVKGISHPSLPGRIPEGVIYQPPTSRPYAATAIAKTAGPIARPASVMQYGMPIQRIQFAAR
jgi:hypothetical protein